MKKIFVIIAVFVLQFVSAQAYLEEKEGGYKGGFYPQIKSLPESLNFILMGDFGRFGQYEQQSVADAMGKAAMTISSDFVITVGDNFYPNGVRSTQDPQWNLSFENIYTNFGLHNDWFAVLGNHDYRGNIQAEIDYTNISRRWNLPATYYEKLFKVGKGAYLQVLFIDTNPFVYDAKKNAEKMPDLGKQDTAAQLKWIEEKLASNDKKIVWRVVVGHHPLYSGGKRKTSKETIDFKNLFEPIFNKYKVDAYLCGHEHDLQIIKPQGASATQFLSGAACEIRPTGNTDGTLFAADKHGFMTFSVTENAILVQTISKDGKVLFENTLKK